MILNASGTDDCHPLFKNYNYLVTVRNLNGKNDDQVFFLKSTQLIKYKF